MKEDKRVYKSLELDELVNKEHNCIVVKECNRKIELQAKYLKDVKTGIKEALNKRLNKFDYSLNGILLDYRNLKVLADEWTGRIVGRYGEFIVTVQAKFYVFDPKIGSLLEGVVNAKSDTHVGILVHKCFNAMILKPDIDGDWNCDNIQIGDKIIFSVIDHVFSGRIPHIEGVLAEEFNNKSPGKKKKKSKVLDSENRELKQNGEISNEEAFTKNRKKSNVLDELNSSKSNFNKQKDEISADIYHKSQSERKSSVPNEASVDNLMEVDEPCIEMKKKKKKHKEKEKRKNDHIIETEKADSFNASSVVKENPMSTFPAIVPMTEVDESLKIKKKKDRKKDGERLDESLKKKFQDFDGCEPAIEKTWKKSNIYTEDSEITESCHKKKKKKHDKKKDIENLEEPVLKSKKKSDKGNLTEQKEISQTERGRTSADDDIDDFVNPVQFIDELMNIKPTDLILQNETSPVKEPNAKNLSGPKNSNSVDDNKKTMGKNSSPNKKKREESFAEITSQNKTDGSPRKKRRLEKSQASSKTTNLEESLFSDEDDSATSPLLSPVQLPNMIRLGTVSSIEKPGNAKGETARNNLAASTTISESEKDNKKDKTLKKAIGKRGEKKLAKEIQVEKSNFGNKSVPQNTEDKTSPCGKTKTTLLQRFEKCLEEDRRESTDMPLEKVVPSPGGKVGETTKESSKAKENKNKETKKVKKTETKQDQDKSKDISEHITGTGKQESKQPLLIEGVDSTLFMGAVTTSTPKAKVNSEEPTGKSKKGIKKTKKSTGGKNDEERTAMIEALMMQTIKKIGLDNSLDYSLKNNNRDTSARNAEINFIPKKKDEKSAKKKTAKVSDNIDRLGSTDSGFNSIADKQKV